MELNDKVILSICTVVYAVMFNVQGAIDSGGGGGAGGAGGGGCVYSFQVNICKILKTLLYLGLKAGH